MGKIEPEKEIKKVVICYEDGEEKELVCIIEGMMELGDRLGMFSPAKEIQEGEEGNREIKRS